MSQPGTVTPILDDSILMPFQIRFLTRSNASTSSKRNWLCSFLRGKELFLPSQVKFTESDIIFLFHFLQGLSFVAARTVLSLTHSASAGTSRDSSVLSPAMNKTKLHLIFERNGSLKDTVHKRLHPHAN